MRAFVAALEKRRYATNDSPLPTAKSEPELDPLHRREPPRRANAHPEQRQPELAAETRVHVPEDSEAEAEPPFTSREDPAASSFADEKPPAPSAAHPRQRVDRYNPAEVRRSVRERDGVRCAYVDAQGRRCREASFLELHHRHPFARGGPASTPNLTLYCRSHNALAAEQDFGKAHAARQLGRD